MRQQTHQQLIEQATRTKYYLNIFTTKLHTAMIMSGVGIVLSLLATHFTTSKLPRNIMWASFALSVASQIGVVVMARDSRLIEEAALLFQEGDLSGAHLRLNHTVVSHLPKIQTKLKP